MAVFNLQNDELGSGNTFAYQHVMYTRSNVLRPGRDITWRSE